MRLSRFFFVNILSIPLLLGCSNNSLTYSSDISSQDDISSINSSEKEEVEYNLIFTELCIGSAASNRAVEIYNLSDIDIDLDDYYIEIYRNYGLSGQEPSEIIDLNGLIKGHDTFVVAYDKANEEILAKADQIDENFLTDGSFPMTLSYKHEQILDHIGVVGYSYDIASHADMVRKLEFFFPRETFEFYDWVRYPNNTYSNLGNINCLDNATLYAGPKLSLEDFTKPYVNESGDGGGGLLEVDLLYTIDGDTSKFDFGNTLSAYGISGSNSLRYYGINTPELAHNGNPEDPYGSEARDYTNSLLYQAKHYLVQSVVNYSLFETYGRVLGYLWLSFVDNPNPEDYMLINHNIILNGYSNPAHVSRTGICDDMLYQGISYVEYLFDANNYAKMLKIHIHEGE